MFNLKSIILNNDETFYNFATGEKLSRKKRVIVKISLSIILSFFFFNIGKDLINAVIAIYAILIGFGFNILFYLLTIKKEDHKKDNSSIEHELKVKKINKLTEELFYNVSYFNVIAVALVLLSLSFFVAESQNLASLKAHIMNSKTAFLFPHLLKIKLAIYIVFVFTFYSTLIESAYTFLRTIGRVTFFFDQKIKIQSN
ncbi:MAG: hypothetical protein ACNI26_05675 [Terasakiella sp.]|uniref:hypothetical protein n=1 Tax=unclassified Terasakiella TaxID=2614952 RepID=UPI003B00F2A1